MLYFLYPLDALLMIGMPILLGILLARKTRASWALFGIGCLTFILSQVVHIPLNIGLGAFFNSIWPNATPQPWHIPFNSVVLGLSAGLCEETARYVGYRWLARRARSFRDALMLGAGHGGIEAILLGLYVAVIFVQMVALRQMGLESTGLTGGQLDALRQQVDSFWNTPEWIAMIGAAERLFALMIHLTCSVLVLQVFTRRNLLWLLAAIGYHALVDALAVFGAQSGWPILAIEATAAVMAVVGLAIMWGLRPRGSWIPPEPEEQLVEGASTMGRTEGQAERHAEERVEDSRFA